MKKAPKNTRQEVIKLLKKFNDNTMYLANEVKERDPDWHRRLIGESIGYDTVIAILESQKDFEDYWKIFNKDEEV